MKRLVGRYLFIYNRLADGQKVIKIMPPFPPFIEIETVRLCIPKKNGDKGQVVFCPLPLLTQTRHKNAPMFLRKLRTNDEQFF